jgi:peptidoglycan/LPS O-acetylase OafA/YrhL
MERLGFLDSLRGFAALYVLLFHFALVPVPKPDVPPWLHSVVMFGGSGVLLFFVVSAFSLCLTATRHSVGGHLMLSYSLARLFRIAPLYFFMLLLSYCRDGMAFGVWHSPAKVVLSATFLFNLIPGYQDGIVWASWTVGVEAVFYSMFLPIYLWQTTMNRKVVALCVSLAATVIFDRLVAHAIPGADLRIPFLNFSFIHYVPVFLIGMFAYDVFCARQVDFRHPRLGASLVGLGVLGLVLIGSGFLVVPPLASRYVTAVSYALVLVGLPGSGITVFDHAVARFLGKISYSIYLWHAPIVFFLSGAYARLDALPGPVTLHFLLDIMLTLAVTIPLSWLSYRIVERPGIELGRQVLARLAGVGGSAKASA